MHLRRSPLPKTPADIGCFLLIFTFIPITFVFEMAVVLPEFHDTGGLFYCFTWMAGLFLLFNLVGNMLALMLVDTSIQKEILKPPKEAHLRKLWHYCEDCEALVPPRSWHCQICRTCILKRDHHCLFTGSCVGHHNHRFFLLFLIYLFIGSTYATVYNTLYFWSLHTDTYANMGTAIKMVFPMLMLVFDVSWKNLYLLTYELTILAVLISLVLIIYHGPSIRVGAVCCEKRSRKYDLGLKRNLEMVFGKRMHLVWLSPFVRSDLPHDGIHWNKVLNGLPKER